MLNQLFFDCKMEYFSGRLGVGVLSLCYVVVVLFIFKNNNEDLIIVELRFAV
jgi:hypothetical protein